jgi:7-cyano-7-deazaguanine synthase
MEKAVILVSGGINSAVAAAVTREQYAPCLLHVNWGHRTAEREMTAFEQLASALSIETTMIADMPCLGTFGGNARSSKRLAIEDATTVGDKSTPATFALGVLPTMLSAAATWAGALGAKRVVVGISEDHGIPGPPISELYPDYRIEFVQAFNLMLNYAKPAGRELIVEAPLLELSRAEVIRLGSRLEVPFQLTWSCFANNEKPCGRCLPCTTRTEGFLRARIPDPSIVTEPAPTAG